MIVIKNSTFDAQGANKKDKVFGITLSGSEDVLISECVFSNMGYSSILNNSTGSVYVENCEFNCENVYNPIEGGQSESNGNVSIRDCHFNGAPGNNYVNFYQFADGSQHEIVNCDFAPTVDNNIMRISNRTSAKAHFLVKDCEYTFSEGEATEYTAFLLCQDYTNNSGKKQDFSVCSVEFDNVLCNGQKMTEDGAAKGQIFYVYEDGAGLIDTNNPKVKVH